MLSRGDYIKKRFKYSHVERHSGVQAYERIYISSYLKQILSTYHCYIFQGQYKWVDIYMKGDLVFGIQPVKGGSHWYWFVRTTKMTDNL